MRILFISNYSELYGANRSMLTVIDYLKNNGNQVKLILPKEGGIIKELKNKQIEYDVVNMFTQLFYYKPQLKYMALPVLDLLTFTKLSRLTSIAKEYNPDLIYSNTSAEMVGIKIAKRLGVKHISHIREFMDLDHGAKYLFGNKSKKEYINQSDGVIYVSNAVANHVNQGEPLKEWQQVIYNGVVSKDDNFENRPLKDNINFGIVGIFDPEKGQDLAIKYFADVVKKYPHSKLHLWGDKEGGYKKYLYALMNGLSLHNSVVFHGFEKITDVIYGDMDILLMCSRCEGFGRVTVEAMQRGIPVMGYNAGGTTELVRDGFNGYLFSNQDEFNSKLTEMLQSEEHFNMLRKNAYNESREKYSVEVYCNNVECFIRKVMEA